MIFRGIIEFPQEIVESVKHHSELDIFLLAKYDDSKYKELLKSIFVSTPMQFYNSYKYLGHNNDIYTIDAIGFYDLILFSEDSHGKISAICL